MEAKRLALLVDQMAEADGHIALDVLVHVRNEALDILGMLDEVGAEVLGQGRVGRLPARDRLAVALNKQAAGAALDQGLLLAIGQHGPQSGSSLGGAATRPHVNL